MLPTVTRHPLALRDLLRLVALWLACIVLVQGFAAAFVRIEGPLHTHRPSAHDVHGVRAVYAVQHHHHGDGERHHHAAADPSVLALQADADAEAALQAAGAALSAAFLLLALGQRNPFAAGSARLWCAALPWPCLSVCPESLLKPPRRA